MFYRNAFLSASKRFVEKDLDVSVAGRSFMITGANSGIGKATAMAIAKRGTTPTTLFVYKSAQTWQTGKQHIVKSLRERSNMHIHMDL